MDIAILGTGRVGSALGRRWAENGHRIFYGARDVEADEMRQALETTGAGATAASLADAAAAADVIVLAVPWSAAGEVLRQIAPVDGKLLIDCINPIKPDFSGLDLGPARSAAEQIAQWAPAAKVVKAFNTVSDPTMLNAQYGDQAASMFYCGNDPEAKDLVRQLTEQLGMEPVDAGPLSNACYLESLAMLYIYLAIFGGWGAECAFKMVKR